MPPAVLVSPPAFLIGSAALLIGPPFSRFSGQSFSAQHDVERYTSSPTGDGTVGKHLVHQVKAETLLGNRRSILIRDLSAPDRHWKAQ